VLTITKVLFHTNSIAPYHRLGFQNEYSPIEILWLNIALAELQAAMNTKLWFLFVSCHSKARTNTEKEIKFGLRFSWAPCNNKFGHLKNTWPRTYNADIEM
jgi:hypothetical protein